MPTSTAATTTRASSPGLSPASLIGTSSAELGRSVRRQLHVERERARRAVDREPLHADGAAGHALRRRIERTAQGGDEIGAGAPVPADGQRHPHGCPLSRPATVLATSRSVNTLSVRRPAVRAVTATFMASPDL